MDADATAVLDVVIGVLRVETAGESRVLIARRRPDAVLGGCWEFPGGKVEPGELLEHALRREFMEELGVAVRVGRAMLRVEHDYAHARVRLHVFACEHEAGVPRAIAVDAFAWVAPGSLERYTFPEANGAILRRVIEDERARGEPGGSGEVGAEHPV